MHDSIWMDEAWVANSVLAPTVHEMLFATKWTQSSPPLFLLAERGVAILGPSEPVLRLLPVAAGFAGLFLLVLVFDRWLSRSAAWLGLALLAGNYYFIKYCQQVKQYGTDFLVSALLLWLAKRYLEKRTRGNLVFLTLAGLVSLFLSYTAAFWLPTLILTGLFPVHKPPSGRRPHLSWMRAAAVALVLGSALGSLYLLFIGPNRTSALARNFQSNYLDLRQPITALLRTLSTLGILISTRPGLISVAVGGAAAVLMIIGVLRALSVWRNGDDRGALALLAGCLPPACAFAAGALALYPVLDYPRMLIFALPSLALLMGLGVDALLAVFKDRPADAAVPAVAATLAIAGVLVSQFVFFHFPRPNEENRPAIAFLKSKVGPTDILFIHGGMYEQYKYYRRLTGFHPGSVYVGNEQWPCCATGDRLDASSPSAPDFRSDLLAAAGLVKGNRLWFFFPAGLEGHWSAAFAGEIRSVPAIMSAKGCTRELRQLFGYTLVESYSCPVAPPALTVLTTGG